MTKRDRALRIIKYLVREYPNAGTLLKFNNTFELVIAVALSAQTTDDRVNQVSGPLFARFPTPESMAGADIKVLEEIIRPVGIYRNKAKHIRALAQTLMEQYDGRVPDSMEELTGLPGLGRKSANVILAVGFGKPGLGVDTHVQRVARRLGLATSDKPAQTELELKKLIPPSKWGLVHHLFIFHGRNVCKARRPDCQSCRIQPVCEQNMDK